MQCILWNLFVLAVGFFVVAVLWSDNGRLRETLLQIAETQPNNDPVVWAIVQTANAALKGGKSP